MKSKQSKTASAHKRRLHGVVRHEPKHKTCRRCDGAKWFDSAIGPIACQSCDATGKGEIDLEWLVADWKRLKQWEHELNIQCDDAHHAMMNGPRIAQSLMPNDGTERLPRE